MSGVWSRRALLAGALAVAACTQGGYRRASSGPQQGHARVLVFPPHVTLGERRFGGAFRHRYDWSARVRAPLPAASAGALTRRGRTPVFPEGDADSERALALSRLHRPVAESLMNQDRRVARTRRLPTRAGATPGLGDGGRDLSARYAAALGLFVSVTGGYAATGVHLAADIVLHEAFDTSLEDVPRRIIVSLADLRTGDILWSVSKRERVRNPSRVTRRVRTMIAEAPFEAGADAARVS